jgi:hypothetical protein
MKKQIRYAGALLAVVCAIALAACGQTGAAEGVAGMLQHLKPLVANCHGPDDTYVADDGSATGRGDPALTAERIGLIRATADQAAACGGVMKVVLFGRTEAESSTLGEAEFPTSSGTETARLIQADKVEEKLIDEIEGALPTALKEVDPKGTDVLSQLELARQFAEETASGHLVVVIGTDGIQTVGPVVMNTPDLTLAAAREAAAHVSPPDLSGATVQIAGIGKTSGTRRPTTEHVEAMTAFYEATCDHTGATKCLVTTDYKKGAETNG